MTAASPIQPPAQTEGAINKYPEYNAIQHSDGHRVPAKGHGTRQSKDSKEQTRLQGSMSSRHPRYQQNLKDKPYAGVDWAAKL